MNTFQENSSISLSIIKLMIIFVFNLKKNFIYNNKTFINKKYTNKNNFINVYKIFQIFN